MANLLYRYIVTASLKHCTTVGSLFSISQELRHRGKIVRRPNFYDECVSGQLRTNFQHCTTKTPRKHVVEYFEHVQNNFPVEQVRPMLTSYACRTIVLQHSHTCRKAPVTPDRTIL